MVEINIPISTGEIFQAVRKMKKKDREACIEYLVAITSTEYLKSIREGRVDYKEDKTKSHEYIFKRM